MSTLANAARSSSESYPLSAMMRFGQHVGSSPASFATSSTVGCASDVSPSFAAAS